MLTRAPATVLLPRIVSSQSPCEVDIVTVGTARKQTSRRGKEQENGVILAAHDHAITPLYRNMQIPSRGETRFYKEQEAPHIVADLMLAEQKSPQKTMR